MSFLKNIFQAKKQEPQDLGNDVQIYLRKGNSLLHTVIKIKNNPTQSQNKKETSLELTTEEILLDPSLKTFISNLYQNLDITHFSLAIFDENNDPYSYIKLKPTSKPYSLLNKTEKKLFLVPNTSKSKSKAIDISSNYFTIEQKLQKKKNKPSTKKDKVFAGELFSLNDDKKDFSKKQVELTEEKIIISPNGKGRILNIEEIKEIRYDVNSIPQPVFEIIKDKKHVINIKFSEGYSNVYYTKKGSELEKWKKNFESVLLKYKEKQKDLKLTNTIQNIKESIASTLETLHKYTIDYYFYNDNLLINNINNNNNQQIECFHNRFYIDIIEDIISYKENVRTKEFFHAWCILKKLESHARSHNEGEQDSQNKPVSIMKNETKEIYLKVLKQIEEILEKNKEEKDLFSHIGHLLPYDFLDETYYTIKKNILKDIFTMIINGTIAAKREDDKENAKMKKDEMIHKLMYLDVFNFLCAHVYTLHLFSDVRVITEYS